MKRRDFLRLSSLSMIPLSSRINKKEIEIFLFIDNDLHEDLIKKKVLKNYISRLFPVNTKIKIKSREKESKIHTDNLKNTLIKWKEEAKNRNNLGHSNVLITNRDYQEIGKGYISKSSDPQYSVISRGKDLYWIREGIADNRIFRSYSSEFTLQAIAHEIGHNLGLNHKDGEHYREKNTIYSTIMSSYYIEEKCPCEYEIINRFSNKSENKIKEIFLNY